LVHHTTPFTGVLFCASQTAGKTPMEPKGTAAGMARFGRDGSTLPRSGRFVNLGYRG
jgi:hypothetical protein